jgi:hypothetical protein
MHPHVKNGPIRVNSINEGAFRVIVSRIIIDNETIDKLLNQSNALAFIRILTIYRVITLTTEITPQQSRIAKCVDR